jgi:hypothetical protein
VAKWANALHLPILPLFYFKNRCVVEQRSCSTTHLFLKRGTAMGVERAVTRWYIQRQTILNEIAILEAKLALDAQTQAGKQTTTGIVESQANDKITQKLVEAQQKLRNLGPCPKPMMG